MTRFLVLAAACLCGGFSSPASTLQLTGAAAESPASDDTSPRVRLAGSGPTPISEGGELTAAAEPARDAFDEMLRTSTGQRERWTVVPELVVLTSLMEYDSGPTVRYRATSEQLSEEDVEGLVADLTVALRVLTDNTFEQFAAIHRESVSPGTDVTVVRRSQIVVGRYRGLMTLENTIGLGGRRAQRDGTITAAAVILDNDYDRNSSSRRLLRTHELGHALGFNHVASRPSIMNARIGAEPTDLDRQVARFAFHRPRAHEGN